MTYSGTVHLDDGTVFGPAAPHANPDRPDLDVVPGWRPVAEGVRHIGSTAHQPPVGVTAEALCGRLITVSRRRRERPELFDCHACWHVWLGVE
ncbi:hypothetical protein HQ32_00537 [Prauserella sp. Am3]|nr:hypothetical protein HQ32_00537 [Prauserella sp. Am3]